MEATAKYSQGKVLFFIQYFHVIIKDVYRSLYHYQQKSNWDCGVACVLMALSDADTSAREEIIKRADEICKTEGFGHSTWTIDLCYLIKV